MLFKSTISGYEITYCNVTEVYQLLDGEAVIKESKSFPAIEKYIAIRGESKKEKKRLDKKVFYHNFNGYTEGVITSIAESGYSRNETYVWLIINNIRRKEDVRTCYAYTQDNRDKITKINEMKAQT